MIRHFLAGSWPHEQLLVPGADTDCFLTTGKRFQSLAESAEMWTGIWVVLQAPMGLPNQIIQPCFLLQIPLA